MTKIGTILSIMRAYKNWPTWFLLYFGLLQRERYILRTRSGESFYIRTRFEDIHRIGEIYHLDEYGRVPIPNGVVVDIGAHCGFFSIYASTKANKVYSFEPVEQTFKAFTQNVNLNRRKNIVLERKGVAKKAGKAKIYIDENAAYNSLYRKTSKFETITLTTLKQIMDVHNIKQIDYLKIDCEGAEFDILMNLPVSRLRRVKAIVLEYHDLPEFRGETPQRLPALVEHLEKNGFAVEVVPNGKGLGMLYAT